MPLTDTYCWGQFSIRINHDDGTVDLIFDEPYDDDAETWTEELAPEVRRHLGLALLAPALTQMLAEARAAYEHPDAYPHMQQQELGRIVLLKALLEEIG